MFVTQQMRIRLTTGVAKTRIVTVIPSVKKTGQIWPRGK